MPDGSSTSIYVDFALLRRTGILDRLAGPAALEEAEYRKFIEATGFDYRRHLDGVLIDSQDDATFYLATGEFDWSRIESYVKSQGGRCSNRLCMMVATTPGKLISLMPMEKQTLALAVSKDPMAVSRISAQNETPVPDIPFSPAWIRVPGDRLKGSPDLPEGLNLFMQAFRGAERVLLLARPTQEGVDIVVDAPCSSPAVANAVAARLTQSTALMKGLAAQQGRDERRMLSILAGGKFRADGAAVRGFWPIPPGLLEGLSDASK